MYKICYYNCEAGIDYEKELLKEWKIDNICLKEVKKADGRETFSQLLSDADGIVTYYEPVTREELSKMPKLKVISLQSIGYNNVDVEAAAEYHICVTNIPGYCSKEVALHTVSLFLDLCRQITFMDRRVRAGRWDCMEGYEMHRLQGRTFGMVFFGSIAKEVAPIVKALGMNVLVYAPTKTAEYLKEYGVEKADTLEELCERSDVVSMHCPLNKDTEKMMSRAQFARMKKSAFFINTARGGVVDEDALADALKNHEILAAGIDVLCDEEEGKSAVRECENVILTPHAAYLSADSILECRRMALEQALQRLIENRIPDHAICRNIIL